MAQPPAPVHRRRWLMPALVLLIAAALAAWEYWRRGAESEQVQQWIAQICADAAAGRSLAGRINPDDPFAERAIIEQIRIVCDRPEMMARLNVIVSAGDVENAGTFSRTATHTAMLRLNGADELGLRVRHDNDSQKIRVVGYWRPSAAGNP